MTINYIYDPLKRLTQANYSTGDHYDYAYDAVGNRLTQNTLVGSVASTTTYVYDYANRLSSVNGVNYTWDNNGNLLNDGINIYTYDSANRLKTVSNQSSVNSFQYNGFGDRLQETANGNTTTFTMDLNTGLTQALSDGTNHYIYGVDRIAQVNSATEYFLGDALGSVRQLTDQNGEITYASAYDPYGVTTSTIGSSQSMYGYTNEYTSHGLVYLRSRMYSPSIGRFQTKDSWLGNYSRPLSLNRWMYTEGNPINYIDPTGLVKCPWNPALNCSRDQVLAYYLQGLYRLLGISSGASVNIPTVGEIHTTGTPSRMFLERTGPGLSKVADTGLSFMPGYDEINTAFGYNQITGQQYTSEERAWMTALLLLGMNDCLKLPAGKAINSRSGEIITVVLTEETTFYRIWGGKTALEGSWLSVIRPATRKEAIYGLALEPGNTAEFVSEVVVPAGTRVQISIAKSMPIWGRYGGGWLQVELLQLLDPKVFKAGQSLPIGLLPGP